MIFSNISNTTKYFDHFLLHWHPSYNLKQKITQKTHFGLKFSHFCKKNQKNQPNDPKMAQNSGQNGQSNIIWVLGCRYSHPPHFLKRWRQTEQIWQKYGPTEVAEIWKSVKISENRLISGYMTTRHKTQNIGPTQMHITSVLLMIGNSVRAHLKAIIMYFHILYKTFSKSIMAAVKIHNGGLKM